MEENIMHFSILMSLLFLPNQISLVLSRDIGLENDLYEGDIAVRTSLPLNSSSSVKLAALRDISKTWPGGKIPYRIDTESIPNQNDQDLILAAMATLTRKVSCIEFQDNDQVQRFDYVRIAGNGDKSHSSSGCWSYVGMQGGEQTLNLGTGCFTEEIILHEFLHLLGFIHEQNRPDRDDFVNIIWSNVQPGMKKQFEKRNENDVNMQDTPYDFRSRMHYPAESFSKSNAPTIVAHHPGNDNFGPLDKLSATDIVEVSLLYHCHIQSSVLVRYNHANRYSNEVRIDQVWDEVDAINGTTEAKLSDIDENMEVIKVKVHETSIKVDSCDAQMQSLKELLEKINNEFEQIKKESSEMKSEITELKAKNEKMNQLNTVIGLVHVDSQYSYHKVPVKAGSTLTSSVIKQTCEQHGMTPQCYGSGYTDGNCILAPNVPNPSYEISTVLCGYKHSISCPLLDHTFWYMHGWYSGSSWGSNQGRWTNGTDITTTREYQYFAVCLRPLKI